MYANKVLTGMLCTYGEALLTHLDMPPEAIGMTYERYWQAAYRLMRRGDEINTVTVWEEADCPKGGLEILAECVQESFDALDSDPIAYALVTTQMAYKCKRLSKEKADALTNYYKHHCHSEVLHSGEV